VLLRIPFDRRIAVALSDGTPLVRALPEFAPVFAGLLRELRAKVPA